MEKMTDTELLEKAALKAGMKIDRDCGNDGWTLPGDALVIGPDADGEHEIWNPLSDDGDAMRLARKLRMTVADEPSRGGWSAGCVVKGEFKWLAHHDDLNRAIVQAAANYLP